MALPEGSCSIEFLFTPVLSQMLLFLPFYPSNATEEQSWLGVRWLNPRNSQIQWEGISTGCVWHVEREVCRCEACGLKEQNTISLHTGEKRDQQGPFWRLEFGAALR